MNKLDKQIYDIFCKLISTGNKYLESINYLYGQFIYKVGNKTIVLGVSDNHKDSIFNNSYTTMKDMVNRDFKICNSYSEEIETDNPIRFILLIQNKGYYVPKLERAVYANALDTLEDLLAEKESKTLNFIFSILSEKL